MNSLDIVQSSTVFDDLQRSLGTRSTTPPKNILIFNLAPLKRAQIHSFLEKRVKARSRGERENKVSHVLQKIDSIYNLGELATRPILLEMISETVNNIGSAEIRNAADLYERYTNAWIDIDARKGTFRTLVSREDRLFFSMSLAWNLFERGANSVHYKGVSDLVAQYFELDEEEDVDHFSSDVRTCTFLKRDDNGNYSFAHQSFLEYFCARLLTMIARQEFPTGKLRYSVIDEDDALLKLVGTDETLFDIENISLSAIGEDMPNILYYLSDSLGFPVSMAFWSKVEELIEGHPFPLRLLDTMHHDVLEGVVVGQTEDSWNLMVRELARGSMHIGELAGALAPVKWTYDHLINTARGLTRKKKTPMWAQELVDQILEERKLHGANWTTL